MIPQAVHTLMENSSEEAVEAALEDAAAFFWVEWREDDDQISGLCEAVLKTGELSADWDDDDSLAIVWRGKRFPVPLTRTLLTWITWIFYSVYWMLPSFVTDLFLWPSRGNRYITLVTLNEALHPDFEIRVVKQAVDGNEPSFLPMTAADWRALEQQYGPAVVGSVFAPLAEHHNLFTEERLSSWLQVEQAR